MIHSVLYKICYNQNLLDIDRGKRLPIAFQFRTRAEVNAWSPQQLLWSGEVHFYLSVTMTVNNCRIWNSERLVSRDSTPCTESYSLVRIPSPNHNSPFLFEKATGNSAEKSIVSIKRKIKILQYFIVPHLQQG